MGFLRGRGRGRSAADPAATAGAQVLASIAAAYAAVGMRIGERGDEFHAFHAGAFSPLDLAKVWLTGRLRALWELSADGSGDALGPKVQLNLRKGIGKLALSLAVDDQPVADAYYKPELDRLNGDPLVLVTAPGLLPCQLIILEVLADLADLALIDARRSDLRRDLSTILWPLPDISGDGPQP